MEGNVSQEIRYVYNAAGEKEAVLVPIAVWERMQPAGALPPFDPVAQARAWAALRSVRLSEEKAEEMLAHIREGRMSKHDALREDAP